MEEEQLRDLLNMLSDSWTEISQVRMLKVLPEDFFYSIPYMPLILRSWLLH